MFFKDVTAVKVRHAGGGVLAVGQRTVTTATCWTVTAALRSASWRRVSTVKVSWF